MVVMVLVIIPNGYTENVTGGVDHANLIANTTGAPSEYYITIDPIRDHKIGDVFFINGTTNIPACENFSMDIADVQAYGVTHMQEWVFTVIRGKYVSIPYLSIVPNSGGINRWSVNVTDVVRELNASEYTIDVWSEINMSYNNSDCPNVREATMEFLTLYPANATIITDYSTTQTPVQRSLTETPSLSPSGSLPTTSSDLDNLNAWLPQSTESSAGPFITIDPVGICSKKEILFMNGSTNLPVSKTITIEITDFQWFISPKDKASPDHPGPQSYQSLSDIPIFSSPPSSSETNPWAVRNRWSANITDSIQNLKSADYLIDAYSSVNYGCNTSGCSSPEAIASQVFRLDSGNVSVLSETSLTPVEKTSVPPLKNGTPTHPPTTRVASSTPFLLIIVLGITVAIKFCIRKRG